MTPTRPPLAGDPRSSRRYQVLPVSARSSEAADAAIRRLGEHLRCHPDTRLADAAFTLQVGRKTFEHRRVIVAGDTQTAVAALSGADGATLVAARVEATRGRPVAFLLAGVGEQYAGLAGDLYRREPAFRTRLDECLSELAPMLPGTDLADLIIGDRGGGQNLAALLWRSDRGGDTDPRATELRRTGVIQPLIFAVDYAIAGTLVEWGIRPAVMLGYSLGEYVAACLAGVFSLPDAIALVAYRAALISEASPGAMTAVPLSAAELRGQFRLEERGLDIAAVNGPCLSVVAGPRPVIMELAAELRQADIPSRLLDTTHAFHSRMLAPASDKLTGWIARNVRLKPPALPYLSNVTGGLAAAELVCDPAYWARHMCEPVQFAAAAATLLADEQLAVIEIGPGQSLGTLLRAGGWPPRRWPLIAATLPASADPRSADAVLADCLARLWLIGVDIDWTAYHARRPGAAEASSAPGRIPLPAYPFRRRRCRNERLPTARRMERTADTAPRTVRRDAPLRPRPELITPYLEPEGTTEETIAKAWAETLRIERVGTADDFFELGGTSLLGITLLAALRRSLPDADLPPDVIHEAPTIAALARLVDRTAREDNCVNLDQGLMAHELTTET